MYYQTVDGNQVCDPELKKSRHFDNASLSQAVL